MGKELVSASLGRVSEMVRLASKTLPAHYLAGAHKRGAIYSSRRAAVLDGLFERPVPLIRFVQRCEHHFRMLEIFFEVSCLHRQHSWIAQHAAAVMCSRSHACG